MRAAAAFKIWLTFSSPSAINLSRLLPPLHAKPSIASLFPAPQPAVAASFVASIVRPPFSPSFVVSPPVFHPSITANSSTRRCRLCHLPFSVTAAAVPFTPFQRYSLRCRRRDAPPRLRRRPPARPSRRLGRAAGLDVRGGRRCAVVPPLFAPSPSPRRAAAPPPPPSCPARPSRRLGRAAGLDVLGGRRCPVVLPLFALSLSSPRAPPRRCRRRPADLVSAWGQRFSA